MSITHGISLGWFSPTLPLLRSKNSPVGPIDVSEVMWYVRNEFVKFMFIYNNN